MDWMGCTTLGTQSGRWMRCGRHHSLHHSPREVALGPGAAEEEEEEGGMGGGYEPRDGPWRFAGRALYQLQLVPAAEARRHVPPDLPLVQVRRPPPAPAPAPPRSARARAPRAGVLARRSIAVFFGCVRVRRHAPVPRRSASASSPGEASPASAAFSDGGTLPCGGGGPPRRPPHAIRAGAHRPPPGISNAGPKASPSAARPRAEEARLLAPAVLAVSAVRSARSGRGECPRVLCGRNGRR